MDALFQVVAVLLLVLVNAFFVAGEFSIVTLLRTRVEQLVAEGHPLARSLRRAVTNPAPFIATTQLGVTMASLALGWIGEPALASVLLPILAFLPEGAARITAHSVATVIAFILITCVEIILGELIPKNLALQRPESVSFVVIEPLILLQAVLRPFIWFLTEAGAMGLRLAGLTPAPSHGLVYSVDELKLLVTASREAGVLDESEEDMLARVFHFAELHAHEVMVPRTEMVSVPLSSTIGSVLDQAAKSSHQQFPVYERSIDNIVGVVYIVDLLRRIGRIDINRAPIRPDVREALVLPETIAVDVLIERMRQHRTHIAILVDEYGGTAGLVKLVDVLERIVGWVPNQFEQAPPEIVESGDGSYLVDGLANLDDVNERTGLNLTSEDYDTIGGFVLGEIGHRPEVGDRVPFDGTVFRVEAIDGLRIAQVRVWPAVRASENAEVEEPT